MSQHSMLCSSGTSQAWNYFRFTFDSVADGVKPVIVKIGKRPAKSFLVNTDAQLVAADFP
jgi:hypothetical protein